MPDPVVQDRLRDQDGLMWGRPGRLERAAVWLKWRFPVPGLRWIAGRITRAWHRREERR